LDQIGGNCVREIVKWLSHSQIVCDYEI